MGKDGNRHITSIDPETKILESRDQQTLTQTQYLEKQAEYDAAVADGTLTAEELDALKAEADALKAESETLEQEAAEAEKVVAT